MKKQKWSASLICADLFQLENDLGCLEQFNMDYLHIDVMDGIFVPRIGMYPEMVHKIREKSQIPIEVHLMIEQPEAYVKAFTQAGAQILTVHLEACRSNLHRTLEAIHATGAKAAVAINPGTEFHEIAYADGLFDYLLLMGIHPGILGQTLKPFMPAKIQKYAQLSKTFKHPFQIIIDGGVNFENASSLFGWGADILVGGSQTIFHKAASLAHNLQKLKSPTPKSLYEAAL